MAKRGQAAMEYLMTYGWAILIVIIAIGALYALGVLNPATWSRDTAAGFGNIGIPSQGGWQLKSDGTFTVQLSNNVGSAINITAVTVTADGTTCSPVLVNNATVPSGTIATGADVTITADCGTKTSKEAYSAVTTIAYTNQKSGLEFGDQGTVTGKVV